MGLKKNLKTSLVYQKLNVKLNSMELGKEVSVPSNPAPEGKQYIVLELTLRNTRTDVQTIIFIQEEVWLLAGKELLEAENYKIENNLDPGQESSGYVLFAIPENTKKVSLLFGKKNTEKIGVNIKL